MIYLKLSGICILSLVVIFFTREDMMDFIIGASIMSLIYLVPISAIVWMDLKSRSKNNE